MASNIWDFFEISNNDNYADCDLCSVKISRGRVSHTTSAMWKHLKSKHLSTFHKLKGKNSQNDALNPDSSPGLNAVDLESHDNDSLEEFVDSDTSVSSGISSTNNTSFKIPPQRKRKIMSLKQTTLTAVVDKMTNFRPGDKRAKIITRLIAEMICKDNQPLSIVEDKGFRKLINHLEPRYAIPSRKHFSQKVIPDMYEEEKVKVKALLERTEYIGITTDMWTSTSSDDYLSLTAHFIDEIYEYHHACLECIPFPEISHTGVAIRNFREVVISDWNILDKVVCVLRDDGLNMVAALEGSAFEHLRCLAHNFQLVIKDGLLNKSQIKNIMSASRKIVGHFKHSTKAMKILRISQSRLGIKPHRLIQDEPTRWNSQLHMLKRLVEQRPAILLSSSDLNFEVELSAEDWNVIEEIIQILDVFDRATLVASSSQVTISEVIPLVNSTITALENFHSSSSFMMTFQKDLIISLKRRYESVEKTKLYTIANILDPRFKGSAIINNINLQEAISHLTNEMNVIQAIDKVYQESSGKDQSKNVPADETDGAHGMWKFYNKLMPPVRVEERANWSCTQEIEAYLGESRLPPNSNIFKYWKEQTKFTILRKLSKKFLITPLSTVSSERLFSTSGIIVDKKRGPERVRQLVFLNKNLN